MSLETMTKLATYTIPSNTASYTFSNIPQGYTDLKLVISARMTRSEIQSNMLVSFNGSTSGFTGKYLEGTGSAAVSGNYAQFIGSANAASSTASVFGNTEIYISNYSGNNYKSYSVDSVVENNATANDMNLVAGLWSNSAPITSITVSSGSSDNFAANSTFTIYGIKAMRTAVGNSIKATGGAISFDGTYVVHTFNTSDVFTPTAPLIVDYLVVAGGGSAGGGLNGSSGGGGAGGLRTTTSTSGFSGGGGVLESKLGLASGTAYTITVGAGGAAQSGDARGNNGTDSSLWTITSTGGGGGGAVNAGQGNSGGSGGGSYNNASVGAGTNNQGYAGGSSTVNSGGTGRYPSGGGGGAGAVGANGTGTVAGNGGVGVTTSISGSSITYAGGGGGGYGREIAGSTGTGGNGGTGGGGNGTSDTSAGGKGTANTGGGGGGCGQSSGGGSGGGAGGSGIVIIRYKA